MKVWKDDHHKPVGIIFRAWSINRKPCYSRLTFAELELFKKMLKELESEKKDAWQGEPGCAHA